METDRWWRWSNYQRRFSLNKSRYSGAHLLKPNRRHVNQNQLGRALADRDQPIKALFVFNSNPMAVSPDTASVTAGLSREDLFTIVLEHFQTDSADYADILLPATTFLEHQISTRLTATTICNGPNLFSSRWGKLAPIAGYSNVWQNV